MATYYVEPPRELLDHEEHLPEVIECRCGYVRSESLTNQVNGGQK